MTRSWTGGCACGALRYETNDDPVAEIHCHCLDCQKRSGTGHGSYVTFTGRSGMTIAGEAKTWRAWGDSGAEKLHAFCPTCGTPVWVTFPAAPEIIAIHAASLDDPGLFNPQMVTYGVRAWPWDTMDPALKTFERMPE